MIKLNKNQIIKVNLGCGTSCLEDWINIDSSYNARLAKIPSLRYLLYKTRLLSEHDYNIPWEKYVKNIYMYDIKKPLPFEKNTVNFIYTSHVLEHLYREDAENLLEECFRILCKDGTLRVVVPDLRLYINKYIEEVSPGHTSNDHSPSDVLIKQLDFVQRKKPSIINSIINQYNIHKWMYDEESLSRILTNMGFNSVEIKKYREGRTPDIEFLDNRPDESLYVEAYK